MMEKDINIEDGETLNEAPVDEQEEVAAAKDAEAEETEKETEEAEEKDPLELAQDEIKELKTQLLYKAAEFDNYRKRTLKERAELILNGGEKVLTAILPVGTGEPGREHDRDRECRLRYRRPRSRSHGARHGRRQEGQGHRLPAEGI